MPNIEIHGMGKREEANLLAKRIFQLFADEPYVDEMVVTICDTFVQDRHGISQPFLRLANSCQEHTEEIIGKLRQLGLDVEHLEFKAFYPKQEPEHCPDCGEPVIRNGTCVKCFSCGYSVGCS